MSREFGKVAVLGLGLLGGSVGLALRKRGLAECVAAASRSQAPLEQALADGADRVQASSEYAAWAEGMNASVRAHASLSEALASWKAGKLLAVLRERPAGAGERRSGREVGGTSDALLR